MYDGQGFQGHFQHVLRSQWTRFDRQIGRSIPALTQSKLFQRKGA
jgi:hypothetical protein